jgi:EmrB/QacA subfamily drug resistance transporter
MTPAPETLAARFARLRATPNYRLVALIVACAMFMEHFDATVLATALPTIARDFHVPAVNLSSAITSYLLALAIFIPVSGWLADRFGLRTVFRGAMLVFVGSSILCAFTWSAESLSAARFLQGFGGALMVPVGRLAILRVARKDQIVSAMAWLLVPMLIGPIMGPPLGGFIVTYLDWRWIFYLNVPIGMLGVALISVFIEDLKGEERKPFDWIGFVLCGATLGGLLFGFESASRSGEALQSALLLTAALIAGGLYFAHAGRAAHPVLDLRLFRDRSFRLSVSAGSLTRFTLGGQSLLMPLMFQVGLGMNAAASGALIFSSAVGALFAKAAVGRALRTLGYRNVMLLNGVMICLLYTACGFIRADWPHPVTMALLVAAGFFISIQFTSYNTVAFEHIEQSQMSAASTFFFTMQQMTISVGVCAGALALRGSMMAAGHVEPHASDFTAAIAATSAFAGIATLIHLKFSPNAGEDLSGRRGSDKQESPAE